MSRRSFLAGVGPPASVLQVRVEGTPRSHARSSSTGFDHSSVGGSGRVSWSSDRLVGVPKGFRFAAPQGRAHYPVGEIAQILYEVAAAAANELVRRYPSSERATAVRDALAAASRADRATGRLRWLIGLSAYLCRVVSSNGDVGKHQCPGHAGAIGQSRASPGVQARGASSRTVQAGRRGITDSRPVVVLLYGADPSMKVAVGRRRMDGSTTLVPLAEGRYPPDLAEIGLQGRERVIESGRRRALQGRRLLRRFETQLTSGRTRAGDGNRTRVTSLEGASGPVLLA